MKILQTKATMKEGRLILDNPQLNVPNNTEVEVIIIVKSDNQKSEFEQSRQQMQAAFKNAGIETREEILELIKDVKKELLEERYQ
ncbi:MAG: hypothetical protein QNJ37_20760 [Crocosphaera sp.]|nr:hypothetical protein [Crocosphaera sp.]